MTNTDGSPYADLPRPKAIARARRDLPKSSPLRVLSNGQYGKNVGGRRELFGSVREVSLAEAEARYHDLAAAQRSGRDPGHIVQANLTVARLFAAFVERQLERCQAGEIKPKTLTTLRDRLNAVAKAMGITRATDVRPRDFARTRSALLASYSPYVVGLMIAQTRTAFRWAAGEGELIESVPEYGDSFRPPSKGKVRQFRAKRGFDGRRAFRAEEVQAIVDEANPLLLPCVLLGVSGGMLATDLAELPASAIDLGRGFIDFPRTKTAIGRRVPIWPETRAAIEAWQLWSRQTKRDRSARKLAFVTSHGLPLVRRHARVIDDEILKAHETDSIAQAFSRVLKTSGVRAEPEDAPGIGFSTLRRTFATIADRSGDRLAKGLIMGHSGDGEVDDSYVDEVHDERILRVSQDVRAWFLGLEPERIRPDRPGAW